MADALRIESPPTSFRLVATLGATGLLSGLIIVGAYLATAPRIERNRAEALLAAVYRVLPGATRVEAWVVEGDTLHKWDGPEGAVPKGEAAFAGYDDDGRRVGFAIPDSGSGFMDTIGLIYGLDPRRGVIVGMEVLDSRETPGLGDKIGFDEHFLENFKALEVRPSIVPVKKGRKSNPNEVDCITGATISSEAVVKILNQSTVRWLARLEALEKTEAADAR